MFKFLKKLFAHEHCYCDKKHDYPLGGGTRLIVMACNTCGKEQSHIIGGDKND